MKKVIRTGRITIFAPCPAAVLTSLQALFKLSVLTADTWSWMSAKRKSKGKKKVKVQL